MVDRGRAPRLLATLVVALLVAAALAVLGHVYAFGQSRFLSIDEFQWGHATWLVSQGQVPYRDFYEHHLPVGYTLHAPLLDPSDGFASNTLRLRDVAFFYMLAALAGLGWASLRTNRSWPEVWLQVAIVPSIGFGLMSAIDYRGDNWAAFTLLASLAIVEAGHTARSPAVAAVAGALFALAVSMTQKVVLLGGGAVALLLVASVLVRSARGRQRLGALRIERPWAFVAGAGTVTLILLGLGLALGLLGPAWEINVLHALQHESLYPGFGSGQFFRPYWTETALSTTAIVLAAGAYVAGGPKSFWALPLLASLGGVALVRAPFPYNFVLVSWLVGVCAVRGYCRGVRGIERRVAPGSRIRTWLPLAYLLPLLVVPQQLGFVSGTSTLDDQLRLLEQVERYSEPNDVVIDSAGSALFRPNRGYHWYHGRAHVKMFADWFDGRLVEAMRASRAPLWIRTVRFDLLPEHAARYLLTHYVPLHGDLHVLGFATRATGPDEHRKGRIDVVRGGRYYVSALDERGEPGSGAPAPVLLLDGERVQSATLDLTPGLHALEVPPGTPALRISYLPPEAFGPPGQPRPHTPLFEYRRSRRPPGGASS